MSCRRPSLEAGFAAARAQRADGAEAATATALDVGGDADRAVLVARNLSRRCGDLLAVDDVSFEVEAGEIVGLLGPNGAGKTTVIRMLTTMLHPSSGDFSILGRGSRDATRIRQQIGVFPENSATPGSQSGRAEVEYYARLYGHSRGSARAVADSLLGEVGLTSAADRPSRGYSRGMRQRLGIARALVSSPAVIFLDEPTLGLDPAGRREVLDIILDAAGRRGAAVVVSTHLLDEVERVCDRVLILDGGRLVAAGTVEELRVRAGLPSVATVRVEGDLTAARSALSGVAAVEDVADGPPASGELRATVTERSGDAVLAIVGALSAARVSVTGFTLDPARLEDVFLSLTGGLP